MEVIPAILTDEPSELIEQIKLIEQSKKYKRVQVDFVDGQYANNKSIEPDEVERGSYPQLKFDAHLMVVEDNLVDYLQAAQKVGFDRIIVQVEKISHPGSFSALALDIDTDVSCIDASMHRTLKLILLMAVRAGEGGQEFDKRVLSKISKLSELRKASGYKYKIGVDGGVEQKHLQMLEKMGVDEVAVGARRVLEW